MIIKPETSQKQPVLLFWKYRLGQIASDADALGLEAPRCVHLTRVLGGTHASASLALGAAPQVRAHGPRLACSCHFQAYVASCGALNPKVGIFEQGLGKNSVTARGNSTATPPQN